jgi:hypothetical protein
MRLSRLSPLLAGLLALSVAAPLRAAAQRVGEAAVAPVPGNLVSGAGASVAAPAASLSAGPNVLPAPGVLSAPSAAVSPAPLAPALAAPAPLAAASALAPAPVAAVPAAPLAALKDAGLKLDAAKNAGDAASAPAALDAMFENPAAKNGGGSMVDARVYALSQRLDASTGKTADAGRRMPPGVRVVFHKSLVMGGGMAALFAGLWPALHAAAPAATFAQYAAVALPLALLPLHFALVSGFWAGRYYLYPKLSDAGRAAFRTAWTAVAAVYPAAAFLSLGAWAALLAGQPSLLLFFSPVALLAVAELLHHFVYRVTPERAQDKGKSLLDWKSRAGGNIGQQLRRMGRRPA